MLRLILIGISILIHWYSYFICEYYYPNSDDISINKWDLLKHTFFMFPTVLIGLYYLYFKEDKYTKYCRLLICMFVIVVLPNDIICNFQGDRDFHKIEILFVLLGLYEGTKDIFPRIHLVIGSNILGIKLYNKIYVKRRNYNNN